MHCTSGDGAFIIASRHLSPACAAARRGGHFVRAMLRAAWKYLYLNGQIDMKVTGFPPTIESASILKILDMFLARKSRRRLQTIHDFRIRPLLDSVLDFHVFRPARPCKFPGRARWFAGNRAAFPRGVARYPHSLHQKGRSQSCDRPREAESSIQDDFLSDNGLHRTGTGLPRNPAYHHI